MFREKLWEFALKKLLEYIEENGAELAEQLIEWIVDAIESKVTPETFASPGPCEGAEDFCGEVLSGFDELAEE